MRPFSNFLLFLGFCFPSAESQSKIKCQGGALFLSSEQNTYSKKFTYDCSYGDLEGTLGKLKRRRDPFVSYYLRNKREVPEEEASSGDYEDDEDNEYEVVEPTESAEVEVSLSKAIHLIEPTPRAELQLSLPINSESLYSTNLVPIATETASIRINPTPIQYFSSIAISSSYHYLHGSGDFEDPTITQTPHLISSSSSSSSTTQSTTSKPIKKLPKQSHYSGTKFEYQLTEHCPRITPLLSWITIVATNTNGTKLLALPSVSEISDWEFEIHCNDFIYEFYLSVRQRQKSRNYNHYFKVEFSTLRRDLGSFSRYLDGISGGAPNELILVKYDLSEHPFYFEFVNESVVIESLKIGSCPTQLIEQIYKNLKSSLNQTKDFKLNKLSIHGIDSSTCEKSDFTPKTIPKVNYPPSIKNQIDKITGQVGKFLLKKIPTDFCYDPEDGETNKLKLSLKNLKTFETFGDSFWLQFDEKNQEIYGLPMEDGKWDGVLVCGDSGGKTAQDALSISITPPPEIHYSAEFSLHFSSIPWIPKNIRKFVEKLGKILSPEIQVKSYSASNSHVLFKWYNSSNPSNEVDLTGIRKILFSDEGGVDKFIKMEFAPEFNLTNGGGIVPVGGVVLGGSSPIDDIVGGGDVGGGGGGGGADGSEMEDNFVEFVSGAYLTTYIIPSILIAVILLLALIAVCLFSKRKQNPEKTRFIGGVPVIFQDELEQQVPVQQQPVQMPMPPRYVEQRRQQQQMQQQHPGYHPQQHYQYQQQQQQPIGYPTYRPPIPPNLNYYRQPPGYLGRNA